MIVGQKVVCVDDKFPIGTEKYYTSLPQKDVTYVIRNVSIGVNWMGEAGEVCLHLIGIVNPKSDRPPFPERGFNSERFRPLDEIQSENQIHQADKA